MIWCLPTLSSPWHPGTTPWNTWKRCAPSTLQVGSLWAVKGHCLWDFMMRCWWDFAHTSFQINMFETWFSSHYSHPDPDRGRWVQKHFSVFLIDMCSCDQVLLGFSGAPWIHELDKWSYDVLWNVWQVFESMVWYVWCVLEFIYILSCILNYIISPTSGMSM